MKSVGWESLFLMYSYEWAHCLDRDTIQNQAAISFFNGAELCEEYDMEVWICLTGSVQLIPNQEY